MTGYELLANAIIEQASMDYMKALCDYHKYCDREALYSIRSLEIFFRSEQFKLYTQLDGGTLIRRIKEHVEEHNYKIKDIKKLVEPEL